MDKEKSLPVAKIIPIKVKAKASFTLVKPLPVTKESKSKQFHNKTLPAKLPNEKNAKN
jgi:hypothetical protein